MDGALAEAAALHGSILRSERGAPSLGCASQPCNQISSASEPTSSAAIVQLNARSRAGLDSQPRSDTPITAHRLVEGRLMLPKMSATRSNAAKLRSTEESRVGNEWVSTGRSRWRAYHKKKKYKHKK